MGGQGKKMFGAEFLFAAHGSRKWGRMKGLTRGADQKFGIEHFSKSGLSKLGAGDFLLYATF